MLEGRPERNPSAGLSALVAAGQRWDRHPNRLLEGETPREAVRTATAAFGLGQRW